MSPLFRDFTQNFNQEAEGTNVQKSVSGKDQDSLKLKKFREAFGNRYLLKDGIDGVARGSVHDQHWNVFTGFTFSP